MFDNLVENLRNKNKKKVLVCVDYFFPSIGGCETHAKNLSKVFSESGCSVFIATRFLDSRLPEQCCLPDCSVIQLGLDAGEFKAIVAIQQLKEIIEDGCFGLVVIHADPLTWCLHALTDCLIPVFTTVIAQPLINDSGFSLWIDDFEFKKKLARLLTKERVLCGRLTESGCDVKFFNEYGISSVYIPNFLSSDFSLRKIVGSLSGFRENHKLKSTDRIFINVGNLSPVKNQINLCKYFIDSKAQDSYLVIIGFPGSDMEYISSLRAIATRCNNIILIEGLPRELVLNAISESDIFLLPSLGEVFSIALLEAMSFGVPFIASDRCGAALDMPGGLVSTFERFSESIAYFSKVNKEELTKIGYFGAKAALNCFSEEIFLKHVNCLVFFDEKNRANEVSLEENRRLYKGLTDAVIKEILPPCKDAPPFFSVIVTTYNRRHLLELALASLRSQTFKSFEVILVNDAGEFVEQSLCELEFKVVYLRQGYNKGVSAARNAALSLVSGLFICFLDDDDLFYNDHLEVLFKEISYGFYSVYYTDAVYATEKKIADGEVGVERSTPYIHGEFSLDRLLVSNYIPINTWCIPSYIFSRIGCFDVSFVGLEDWELFLRIATTFKVLHVPKSTVEVSSRIKGSDHASIRYRENFLEIFHRVYLRYPTMNDVVSNCREKMLLSLAKPVDSVMLESSFIVNKWLEFRFLSNVQRKLIFERLTNSIVPSIGFFILARSEEERELIKSTLSSFLNAEFSSLIPSAFFLLSFDCCLDNIPLVKGGESIVVNDDDFISKINLLVSENSFEWFVLLSAGDLFTPNGLLVFLLEMIQVPSNCRVVYSDFLSFNANGELDVFLRPSFSLDFSLSFPVAMAKYCFFKRSVLLELSGVDDILFGAFEFSLMLHCIDNYGINSVAHIDEPILIAKNFELKDNAMEQKVLLRHLTARGYTDASIIPSFPGRYRLNYGHTYKPIVSIIIPTKDQLVILQRCVESLLEKTSYQNYEVIIVDNNSQALEAKNWLATVESWNDSKIKVLRYPDSFNYSAINNMAAQVARGEYLVLLNNDTAILQADWLDQLLNHALRPEVGVVGAKLLYSDGRIQHAGVVLGLNGPADHPFIGEPMDSPGYMNRLQVDQNYSAVTAACLMIRKSLYQAVGGMDEKLFKVSYNDVDLCLKVRESGYLIVWTPHAVLMHEGGVSQKKLDVHAQEAKRERFIAEQDAMYAKWLPLLARDPAYNANFSLVQSGGFKLADPQLSWRPLMSWRPLPIILAHNADNTGCGHYRVIQPFSALQETGLIEGALSIGLMHVTDLERYSPDSIVFQRQIGEDRLEAMRRAKAFSRSFKVYELDDYLPNLPLKSVHREHMPKDILKSLRRGLSYVDRFVVSTDVLAEAFAGFHADIHVVSNRLDPKWWGNLSSQRRHTSKPRVGWAGGAGHTGDLEMIADVVAALADEVDWIFFGMCPDNIRPYLKEYHPGVSIEQYPRKLAQLDLDLAIAPVEQNLFNECKSNLRLLEYGVCGFPVICSDIRCYQGNDLPVTRVRNRFRDWVDAIRMHVNDLEATAALGDELQRTIKRDWMLEGANLESWKSAWLP